MNVRNYKRSSIYQWSLDKQLYSVYTMENHFSKLSKGVDFIKSWFLQSAWKIISPNWWFNGLKEIKLSWCILFIKGIYCVTSFRANVGDKLKSKALEWRVILTKMLGCATSIRWTVLAQLPCFHMLHLHIWTRACLSCVLDTCRNTFIFSAKSVQRKKKIRQKKHRCRI